MIASFQILFGKEELNYPKNVLKNKNYRIVPESLRWLLSRGKYQRAESVVNRIVWSNNLKLVRFFYSSKHIHWESEYQTSPIF